MARKDRQAAALRMNIYLTGFMCAGKTAAGRELARLLDRPFCDCDGLIEKRTGTTIAGLVKERGLAHFRALEAAQLRKLAAGGGRVIALGGGIYPSRRWKKLLSATGVTVFLACPWPELAKRLQAGAATRPLLAGRTQKSLARAKKLYTARLPFYNRAAIRVNTSGLTPKAAAREIRRRIKREYL
ncbi:MAG: shikimate kinase [Elusimicrobia bacterium CG08_land_8_20_14_0_20_59_10]|nr:MAG: shikimate kinase [Elusimicrobia bacterium CG08_land_8_20_14_0_20_59_10]